MKIVSLCFLIFLAACSSNQKTYQNNFYIGCMNGQLRFNNPYKYQTSISYKNMSDWCKNKFKEVENK